MTDNERILARAIKSTLPTDIVSYYRNPTDAKLSILLLTASRFRSIIGVDQYRLSIAMVCAQIVYACDHAFIDYMEHELLTYQS